MQTLAIVRWQPVFMMHGREQPSVRSSIYWQCNRKSSNISVLLVQSANMAWRHTRNSFFECEVQFSSVIQSCPTLCDPMNCSTPGLPVHHQLPCPLSRWCHPTILSSAVPFSSYPQSFLASGSFQMSQLFASGGQTIDVSSLYGK